MYVSVFTNLIQAIKELENTVQQARKTLDEYNRELSNLKAEKYSFEAAEGERKNEIATSRREVKEAREQASEYEGWIQERDAVIHELQERVGRLTDESNRKDLAIRKANSDLSRCWKEGVEKLTGWKQYGMEHAEKNEVLGGLLRESSEVRRLGISIAFHRPRPLKMHGRNGYCSFVFHVFSRILSFLSRNCNRL